MNLINWLKNKYNDYIAKQILKDLLKTPIDTTNYVEYKPKK